MGVKSESQLENELIAQLQKQGYEYVKILDHKSLVDNFRKQLNRLNEENLRGQPLTDNEFNRIMNEIERRIYVFKHAKLLRDKLSIESEADRGGAKSIYISFIDNDFRKNHFQVTNQVTVTGKYTNRYDVTLLMNGLPVCQIELKKPGISVQEAFNQINRYKRDSFIGLFKFLQLFVVSNEHFTLYMANGNEKTLNRKYAFNWTDENNHPMVELTPFSEAFLNRSHLFEMITKYMILLEQEQSMIVLRPYQFHAVQKIKERVLTTDKNGYIWHTTGSGKTITCWTTAKQLSQEDTIEKVVLLLDRKDLDNQTVAEFKSFSSDSEIDKTENTYHLIKQMKSKTTKLIVTTTQKMNRAITSYKYDMMSFCDKKVVFIIDECHRSQFGNMHRTIADHFKKGQFIGCTGTPIMPENKSADKRTTTDVFGECLHYYLMKNAIKDKNVLPFSVEYFSTFEDSIREDKGTAVEAIDTKEPYADPKRQELVAQHILDTFDQKTKNRKYNALFTVGNIPELMSYYRIFKRLKHDLNIGAIFSYGTNEDLENDDKAHSRHELEEVISDYNLRYGTSFSTSDYSDYQTHLTRKIKERDSENGINLLIVVNMFTTGFDDKHMNTVFIDRVLEYHTLIQTISRANRIDDIDKQCANIVFYRNLKKKLDDAVLLFSEEKNTDELLVKPRFYYEDDFRKNLDELLDKFSTPSVIDEIESETEKAAFVERFKQLINTLSMLKNFSGFNYDAAGFAIDESVFAAYQSKYYEIAEEVKTYAPTKVSILKDIDFCITIIGKDRINVDYILNLIKNISRDDEAAQKKQVKKVMDELDKTSDSKLIKKSKLIKAFLSKQFLSGTTMPITNEDFESLYLEFEEAQKTAEIEEFAKDNYLSESDLLDWVYELVFSGELKTGEVKEELRKKMKNDEQLKKHIDTFGLSSFVGLRSFADEVVGFVNKIFNKYY